MNFLEGLFYFSEPTKNINILMYHGFTDQSRFNGIENYHGKHLHIDKLHQQMKYLKANYQVLSLEALIECIQRKVNPPARSIVVTIDDGYLSNYTLAYPIFQKYRIPATIFLATDFIDAKDVLWVDRLEYAINAASKEALKVELDGQRLNLPLGSLEAKQEADRRIKRILKELPLVKRMHMLGRLEGVLDVSLTLDQVPPMYAPLTWDQIREMRDSGLMTFGAHTCSHTILTACSDISLTQELEESRRRIETELNVPCRLFSYPNGQAGNFNDRTQQAVLRAGYSCALTTIIGTNTVQSDCFKLNRLNIHNAGDLEGFKRTLSGLARKLRAWKNGHFVSR